MPAAHAAEMLIAKSFRGADILFVPIMVFLLIWPLATQAGLREGRPLSDAPLAAVDVRALVPPGSTREERCLRQVVCHSDVRGTLTPIGAISLATHAIVQSHCEGLDKHVGSLFMRSAVLACWIRDAPCAGRLSRH
jgi:hypothetical protein